MTDRPAPAAPTPKDFSGSGPTEATRPAHAATRADAASLTSRQDGPDAFPKEARAEEPFQTGKEERRESGTIVPDASKPDREIPLQPDHRPPVREDAREICRLCRHAKHRDCKVEGCACPVSPSLPERRREDAGGKKQLLEAQKEVERLTGLHQLDHSLADQRLDKLEAAEARAARMRELLHQLVRSLHSYDEHRWDQQVAEMLLTEGEAKR